MKCPFKNLSEIEACIDIPAPDYSDSEEEGEIAQDTSVKPLQDSSNQDLEENNNAIPKDNINDNTPTTPELRRASRSAREEGEPEGEGEEEETFSEGLEYGKRKSMLEQKLRLLSQEEYEALRGPVGMSGY